MNPKVVPIATFFLGVLLTVGAYETVRLIGNARQALSLASTQIAGEGEPESDAVRADRRRRTVAPRTAGEAASRREVGPASPSGPGLRPVSRGAPPVAPKRGAQRTPAERREFIEARLAEMTELERQEFLERRQERRDRRRGAGRGRGPVPGAELEGERPATDPSLGQDEVDTADPEAASP